MDSAWRQAVVTEVAPARFEIASTSNDHRLGANEAPPAILSVYPGDRNRTSPFALAVAFARGSSETEAMITVLQTGCSIAPAVYSHNFRTGSQVQAHAALHVLKF